MNPTSLSCRILSWNSHAAKTADNFKRRSIFAPARRLVALFLTLWGLASAQSSQAQNLDCVCLQQQSVLFTNGCVGVIPNLCLVVSNCWFPSAGFTSFTCVQNPIAGTVTTSNTFISFTLFAQPGNVPFPCGNLKYSVGFTTNRFTLICPTNQIVACNTTNFTFYGPSGWTNVPPCCTNAVTNFIASITTNWPVLTATWIGQVCGVVDVCTESILFGGLPPAPNCNCLDIVCPSNIVVQTCLNSTAGTGFTNIFYPAPVVSNYCIGNITNLVCTPPPGSPFPVGTNTVTCVVQDDLGNSTNCTFDIIVLGDNDPPNIVCGPDQTVPCLSTWAPIPPLATDVCCGATGTFIMLQQATTNSSPPCLETIEFWWHIFDCNGNATNCTNYVTIVDTTPPIINCNSNQTYSCNLQGTPGSWIPVPPTAFDLCCGPIQPTVTLLGAVTNGNLCSQTITLIWQAEDCCSNSSYCTEVVTLVDTNPPTIICQPFRQVECGSNYLGDLPTAFDQCCGTNVTVSALSIVTNFTSPCFSQYTVTWQAVDCCTNFATCSQIVQVLDTTPPVMTCASNLTIQCGSPLVFTPPTAVDACCPPGSTVVVSAGPFTNTLANCQDIVTMTWQATDCCGNATNCSQSITIVDTTPPVITCGPNQTVQCGTPWIFNPPTATDNCCLPSTGATFLLNVTTNSTGTCSDTITAIWLAVDCCGNKSHCTNFVNVVDTIPPVIACNSNQTYSCSGSAIGGGWTLTPPTAFDLCCGPTPPSDIALVSTLTNGNQCYQIITLTWSATDCCTNTAYCTEIVTLVDTNPPVLNCAPFKVVECGTVWTFDPPTAFDACCGTNITINVASNVTVFSSTCSNILERFWTAVDCCTNVAVCSQRVLVLDTLPPNVTFCPPSFTIPCGTPVVFGTPTATDLCCGALVTISAPVLTTNGPLNCTVDIKATWLITDCCGNSTNCSQFITVVDNVPPVITCAPSVTNQCGTPWTFVPATATDNCCAPSSITIGLIASFTNTVGCTDQIRAVWAATDCCGNISYCTNAITVVDTIPPTISCSTLIQLVQCGSPVLPPAATDLCCTNPTVTLLASFTNVVNSCRSFVTNTWQATDCCTNTATCTETIMIADTLPPVPTCAPNKTVECGLPIVFDPPTALDACCGTNVTITVQFTTPPFGTPCLQTTTRSWLITDCCTNSVICSQTISIVDTTPPSISCGPNQTVPCGSIWGWPLPTVSDNCCALASITLTVSNATVIVNPCTTTYVQAYTATDCCGNSSTCTQTTTTVDTTPPTITCAPSFSVTAGTPWNFTPPTASDNCCGPTIVIMSTTTNVTGFCQTTHTRTWRAVDCCGLMSPLCSQSVVVGGTPPANDPCLNPVTLVLNAPYICGTTLCATPSPPPVLVPAPCGLSANTPDVWYTVTALCTGPMTVDTCQPCFPNPTYDTVLSAYNYFGSCTTLFQVPAIWPMASCNDDKFPCGLRSIITFPAVAGQSYRIRVSGYNGAVGWFSIRATQSITPPPNDQCVNAQIVGVGNPAACGTTICSTTSPPPLLMPTPCGASANTGDVWYRFIPTCSGIVQMNTCGLSPCYPGVPYDTVLSVYLGSCFGTMNEIVCNDDSGPLGPCPWTLESFVQFPATAGVTYYIRVSGWAGQTGNFRLNINQISTPPPNDLCAAATPVNAGQHAWNNCGANTDGPGTPCGLASDVWFRYTPACSGPVMLNTCFSAINTVLAVYSGNCPTLSFLGCNDNAGAASSCAFSSQSYLTFNAIAGVTYRIRVGGFGGVQGSGVLNIVGPKPPLTTCGSGPLNCRVFLVLGPGVGIPWAWSLSSPCCANLQNLATPGVVGPAPTLAAAFAASVNAQCPGTAGSFGPFLVLCTRCGPGSPVILGVGPAGTPPNNLCYVGGWGLPTTGLCSFNPEIVEIETTGQDANNNGIDDYIDIALGTSEDVDGNLVPDETQSCFGPEVTAKPESQLVELGANVTLSVTASGTPPLGYQWLLNGLPLAGATTSNLTINPVTAADLGAYSVTVSNACGVADGTPAEITVEPPHIPVITDANMAEGWFRFMVETKIGYDYEVQYKNDLNDPSWTVLTTVTGDGGPQLIYDATPAPLMRFYRILRLP